MFDEIPKNYQYAYARVSSKSQEDNSEDLKATAERMGKKITKQRLRMQSYGKTPLSIVDLRKLSTSEKTYFKENVIDAIGTSKDLVFVNDEIKS